MGEVYRATDTTLGRQVAIKFVLFHYFEPQTSGDIWVLPVIGDHTPYVFLKTPFKEVRAVFSPDARWVAYHSDESGRDEIYVRPFVSSGQTAAAGATGAQWQVSTGGGIMASWRADGKELYFLNPAGAMMAAAVSAKGSALDLGAPVMLFPTRIVGGGLDVGQGRQYDVTRDGRFLINTELDSVAAPITLLQNWNPESKP